MILSGPLGHKSELIDQERDELSKKKILFVAGGVGAALCVSTGKMDE